MTTAKRAGKTTPRTRAKQTVAEGESMTTQSDTATEEQEDAPRAEALAEEVTDKGYCDNHPDTPAVAVTDFPWVETQRFCNECVPEHYRALL